VNERRGPIIVVVVSVLIALLALVFLLLPRISAVGKRSDDLDAAVAKQDELTTQLSQLEEAKKEAKKTKKQLNRLQTKVPPTAELPSLIRLLQGAADASAVDFLSVSPGTPSATGAGISTIPMQINVTGSFFSVEEFLFKLETLPRAVRVTGITLGSSGDTGLSLTMSSEAYTTDASAGPGSVPGPTEGAPPATGTPAPGATTGATPSTTGSEPAPTETGTGG